MPPPLSPAKHALIRDMTIEGTTKVSEIARAAECSIRSVKRVRSSLRHFGNVKAPRAPPGRHKLITLDMLQALQRQLLDKPGMYLSEMNAFLADQYNVRVSDMTISRTLKAAKWSNKLNARVAQQRNADLRDYCAYRLSDFHSWQLVFIDESAFHRPMGLRKKGWAPVGVRPVQVAHYSRGYRFQILPAYSQDGILLSRIYQGSTDGPIFEDFIEQLLHHCGRYPEPKSVLVMDNVAFHYSDRLFQLCDEAGVKLVHLSPYSPDLNPIEMYFAVVKAFVKRH